MKTYLCIVLTAFMIASWGYLGLQESKKYHFVVKKEVIKSHTTRVHKYGYRIGYRKGYHKGWKIADVQWKDYIKSVGGKQKAYSIMISNAMFSSGVTDMLISNLE